jgi:PEGA domain/PKD domain
MPNPILATGVAACLILSSGTRTTNPARTTGAMAPAGTVTVTTDPPDAAVYVDGQFAGRSPLTVERVEPGDHRVRVVKEGYLEHGRVVSVRAGTAASLQLRLTADAGGSSAAGQAGGISSGPPSSKRKWLYLGAAGGGAAATAVVLATRNRAPTIGTLSASPTIGLQAATPIAFSAAGANDPDGDALSFTWDFADGGTSKEQMPRHVYSAAGSFSVKCTVTDGKHSETGTISVMVRSLAGTWRGMLENVQEMLVLTQSGATVGGTFVDVLGSGAVSGFLATSPPLVRFTILQTGFNPFTFTGDPNSDVTTVAGVVNGSGFNSTPFTISRQ